MVILPLASPTSVSEYALAFSSALLALVDASVAASCLTTASFCAAFAIASSLALLALVVASVEAVATALVSAA